jgi:dTDP-4-amino-4,6-dideoxygalactose transaminase
MRTFRHPQLTHELLDAILRQAQEQISIYDNGGIYAVLERGFRSLSGCRYAVSVNSGTSALLSAYYGLGVEPGDEVVVPAYTFFATATPLLALGATPVLVDCDESGGMDPGALQAAITDRTRAIAVTHMWGIPCDMSAILDAAGGRPIVEDASHAHGATVDDAVVGGIGTVGAWSLQGKKLISAGEGGMLATSDRDVFERAVLLGHFNRRARKEVTGARWIPYTTTGLGMNLRMHPLGAAMAAVQLDQLPRQLDERRESAGCLTKALSDVPGLRPVRVPEGRRPAWYAYPVLIDTTAFPGVSRERLVAALHAEGAVEVDIPGSTRPLSDYPAFSRPIDHVGRTMPPPPWSNSARIAFPRAYAYYDTVIKLPTWYGPRRLDYAAAYASALRKVAIGWQTLA